MDPPFGLGMAAAGWDRPEDAMDEAKMTVLLAQIAATNTATKVFLATHFKMLTIAEITKALESHGFTAVTPVFFYKNGQQTTGTNNYIFSLDGVLLANMPKRGEGIWNMSVNPLLRHNLLILERLVQKQKGPDGKPVNEHEKHPAVAKGLLECHSNPGSTVLVPFAGAGGEVVGAIYAKRNVVAFEKDTEQFNQLITRLTRLQELEELPPICDYVQPRHVVTPRSFGLGIEHDDEDVYALEEEVPLALDAQKPDPPVTALLGSDVPVAEPAAPASPVPEEAKGAEE